MRFLKLKFSFALLALLSFFANVNGNASAGVNSFYFDSFEANYYLSQDEEGISHLRVVEDLIAVFPDYNQNKGIYRQIPITNKNGTNVTLPNLTTADIKVLRNGIKEPIYSLEKNGDHYTVYTGTESYVLGRQSYRFEYSFEKVVTDFGSHQELYWDTNGNGGEQKFNKVKATVHFADRASEKAYSGKQWCYVGKYGESGSERCTITETDNGIEFVAYNLSPGENLTFDIELKAGSFVVPEPETSYLLVGVLVVTGMLCAVSLIIPIRKYLKIKDKIRFYKNYFIKPEYQPAKGFSVAEMAVVYLGSIKNIKVSVLLDMIVNKKILFIKKAEHVIRRDKWAVKIINKKAMREEEKNILIILNNGDDFDDGDEIEVKKHTATSKLISLNRKFNKIIVDRLINKKLVTEKFKYNNSSSGFGLITSWIVEIFIVFIPLALAVLLPATLIIRDQCVGKIVVFDEYFETIGVLMFIATIAIWIGLYSKISKFETRTVEGLKMSRYMDGLKEYIGMAESKRMEFMQSVKNVDITPQGIVKLYEKLLPYAAIFGFEESWTRELEKYYSLDEIERPEWYDTKININDIVAISLATSDYVYSSSTISGGGGSSSSFSGGGGGGFSGGGGGGGGVGGR